MIKKIRSNKGFTGVDIAIAVFIFIVFTGLITGMMYNVASSNNELSRKSEATTYTVQILEYAKRINYDELTKEKLDEYKETLNIPQGYNVTTTVEKYSEQVSGKEDLVKTVTVSINYNTGVKDRMENIEISTLITKK